MDIYFTLVAVTNWFCGYLGDRKLLLLHTPLQPLQAHTVNRTTSVMYGRKGSSVELLDTRMICHTINTYCVRLRSLCFARDVIGVLCRLCCILNPESKIKLQILAHSAA